ncbi:hypothetical protein M8J77_001840 [Diaphorina citri]|nr:hypothetical protein M8J77_001840 [Diaphorina citri]
MELFLGARTYMDNFIPFKVWTSEHVIYWEPGETPPSLRLPSLPTSSQLSGLLFRRRLICRTISADVVPFVGPSQPTSSQLSG